MFGAGYDVSTPKGYEDTMAKFGEVVGFHKLKGEHCFTGELPPRTRD